MRLDFEGETVLVTGAAQGIGRGIVRAFHASGARVLVCDMDEGGLATVEGATHAKAVDLADRDAVQAYAAELAASALTPSIVVNAAGGTRGQAGAPLADVRQADWRVVFEANVETMLWVAQAFLPAMVEEGRGRIVAIASGAGLRPTLTGIQAYSGAKHALVGLVRQLAMEFGPSGVTVNAVAPGFVRSNPVTERQWEAMGPAGQERLMASIHTRRLGTPEDVAAAVLFLASAQASWITGQILSVDGGRA